MPVRRAAFGALLLRGGVACSGAIAAPDAETVDASIPEASSPADVAVEQFDSMTVDSLGETLVTDGATVDIDVGVDSRNAAPPPIAGGLPDAGRCADGGWPSIHLWSAIGELWTLDGLSGETISLGFPCGPNQGLPYGLQMTAAVDGTLYVLFSDWTIRHVSATSCTTTAFVPGQEGFDKQFAIAAANDGQIYLSNGARLGRMSEPSFHVTLVGSLDPPLPDQNIDLAFDAAGRLFSYCLSANGGTTIAEFDPGTGTRLAESDLGLAQGGAWAFTRWIGDFYLFVTGRQTGEAWRFTPEVSLVKFEDLPFTVIGAAADRCIP